MSRDYYCGHFIKGRYGWPPLDLVVMSGRLSEQYEVVVLDAVVDGMAVRTDAVEGSAESEEATS